MNYCTLIIFLNEICCKYDKTRTDAILRPFALCHSVAFSLRHFFASLAQLSFSGTVRLNTGSASVESGSLQK